MLLPPEFRTGKKKIYDTDYYEKSPEHVELTERLKKTLYYGKNPTTERPSLPVTDIAVQFFQECAPRQLGKVDHYYAASVSRRACISPCALMLGMVYIERLKNRNPEYVQNVSSSDLFLISMMVASKYLYDEGVDEEVYNDEWAESAHMDVEDLNELECNFLSAIDWSLFVKPQDFRQVLGRMEQRIALSQSVDRGWFSYIDLLVLMESGDFRNLTQKALMEVCKVVLVCSAAYLAGALVMVGSTASVLCMRGSLNRPITSPATLPDTTIAWQQDSSLLIGGNHSDDDSAQNEPKIPTSPAELESGVGFEPSDHSSTRTRSSIFPGLLTLFAAKDLMMNFLSAVVEKPPNGSVSDETQTVRYSCRKGYCASSNPDGMRCINVTENETGLPDDNEENDDFPVNRQSLKDKQCRNCGGPGSNLDHRHSELRQSTTCRLSGSHGNNFRNRLPMQCCCWTGAAPGDSSGNQHSGAILQPFSDVMFGFRTGVQEILV